MSTTLTQQVLDEFLYTRTYNPVVELDLLAIRTKRQSVDALSHHDPNKKGNKAEVKSILLQTLDETVWY
ncbi:hypothetical protein NC653_039768 [Populus alba x Populus x berolinensis]|uniref:Uncharacterized protein n=1 Tax=Populus alba x Populus x berolinensis TaxID=444605 RepID=A0AAD6LCN5_9ROSI|nr:hypothetical protein NC653_039768 [Populus alba x Populus x berolinensis]